MFGKNGKSEDPSASIEKQDFGQVNGFIGKGMSMEGKLSFEGTVTVEGHFTGNVVSGGIFIVGDGGVVDGDINVDSVVVHGEVKGSINAKSRVELNKPGKVRGDIFTPNLIIEEGVLFEGNCNMSGNVSEFNSYKEAKELTATDDTSNQGAEEK
ncbi:MAG: polymer-forming cytoskeletal protein [Proteobacteria bacterium]|nr:polymer-forming cytoskeletal protein [Pseudomonadota bacterium]